jgi:hypothetical protein
MNIVSIKVDLDEDKLYAWMMMILNVDENQIDGIWIWNRWKMMKIEEDNERILWIWWRSKN